MAVKATPLQHLLLHRNYSISTALPNKDWQQRWYLFDQSTEGESVLFYPMGQFPLSQLPIFYLSSPWETAAEERQFVV